MNKVIYVSSQFKAVGEDVTKEVPTGEKTSGFFGGEKEVTKEVTEWVQTGYSDRNIDGKRLSEDLSTAIEELNRDGYEVVSVTEATSGNYNWATQGINNGGLGYGYGYSFTEGLIVVAKKV